MYMTGEGANKEVDSRAEHQVDLEFGQNQCSGHHRTGICPIKRFRLTNIGYLEQQLRFFYPDAVPTIVPGDLQDKSFNSVPFNVKSVK